MSDVITVVAFLLMLVGAGWAAYVSLRSLAHSYPIVHIAKESGASVAGIPFYVKKGMCKQETIWVEPVFTLTYTRTRKFHYIAMGAKDDRKAPEPIVRSTTKSLSLSQFTKDPVVEFRKRLSHAGEGSHSDAQDLDTLWNAAIASEPDYVPLTRAEHVVIESHDVVMVSNNSTPEAIVDYANAYYYNTHRPWIGSGQVSVKLNADGTLTEGSAQVESTTLQGVLDFVPTKELVGAFAPASKVDVDREAAIALTPGTMTEFLYLELTIKQEDYRHIHTRYVPYTESCAPDTGGVKQNYALRIEAASPTSDKKEADRTIDVAAKVILPAADKKASQAAPSNDRA